jgi:hypothetical protein
MRGPLGEMSVETGLAKEVVEARRDARARGVDGARSSSAVAGSRSESSRAGAPDSFSTLCLSGRTARVSSLVNGRQIAVKAPRAACSVRWTDVLIGRARRGWYG